MDRDPTLRKRLSEFYRFSATYRDQLASHETETAAYFVQWVGRFVSPGSSVLDLGCGTGLSTTMLRDGGYATVGADISELFISARGTNERPHFVSTDALELPFAANRFDAVVSAALIEHLPDVAQALNEMLRVIRPGGLVMVLAPNHCSLTMPIADLMRLLRGRSGRAYFAETPRQALRWFVYNLQLNVSKLVSSEARFRYVQPDLTIGRGGDHDMVYYASPIDLRRHLRQQGAKIVSWSGVRLPPLSRRGRLALRGSGLKRKFVQSIAWPVTGITYVVARKQGGLS